MIRVVRFSAASRNRRYSTGNSSFRSGASKITVADAHVSAIVACGSANTSAGNPSPSCASRAVMPRVSANFAHAYASSLVPRDPPMMPTASGPLSFNTVRRIRPAASSAFDHVVSASAPSLRINGACTRFLELTDSKLKRPRSHSQPQLTDSMSTPWYRTSSSRLLCTTVRQPTLHEVQVLSICSKSHGRALKRYALEVSAPTGQICTVLPEKYELNGSSGKVITWVLFPRLVNEISGSPATSPAKRVQRSQRMQRSRSRKTNSLMGIGFS